MGRYLSFSIAVIIITIKDISSYHDNFTSVESSEGVEWSLARDQTSKYPSPDSLTSPLQTEPRRRLVSGGATNPYNRSFDALRLPMMGMMEDPTIKILFDIQDGIRYVLQTKNEYTVAYHGTGTTGMSGVLDNMIEPRDKVLVCIIGYWGNVVAKIAQRFGANVVRMEKSHGSRFSLNEIEAGLHRHRPNILYLVNGESSTGVYQPIDGIGNLCHKYNCITIVDVIATVGQQPIKMDENKIDVVYMNSQKGLGGIVGLSPVSFSPRAMRKVRRRRSFPVIYQTDINEQADAWFITKPVESRHEAYTHSISVSLLYMLREGLARVAEEGIENVWERHADTHSYIQFRAAKLGLESFVPKPEDRLIGTSIWKAPRGKDGFKIEKYMLEKFGIEISPGLFIASGKVIRVGLFGSNANREAVSRIMDALEIALNSTETNS
ncbi:unnamed protein product [Orchesella dallaii]|uniref:Alanine--glyoxylate aminotransferase n=1 Tax=Orchesella dallaii TaxID=48710 RepID=A0ABP1RYW4_9HEXA